MLYILRSLSIFNELSIGPKSYPQCSVSSCLVLYPVISFVHLHLCTCCNLKHIFMTFTGLWWIILLRAYGKITGDHALQERVDVQTGIRLGLNLCLSDGFDMFPTLLVTDGSCMIDRRMGIHGHPLEIQVILIFSFWPSILFCLCCMQKIICVDYGDVLMLCKVDT